MGAALVLGAAILGIRLGWQDYWWDEHVTLMFTQSSWRELMLEYWGLDTHRPVYYGLQKAWNGIFGTDVAAVRALPAVISLIMVPIFYFTAWQVERGPLAILTVFLLICAPMFVYQGREIRMYCMLNVALSFALLFAVLLANLTLNEAAPHRGRLAALWAALAASLALAFYAQAIASFVALLFGLWIVLAVAVGLLPRRFFYQAALASVLYFVLIIPALWPFLDHFSGTLGGTFWVPEPTPTYIYEQTAAAYPYPKWTKPIIGLMLLWGLWSIWRRAPLVGLLVVIIVVGLPLMVLLISLAKPIYTPRVIAWASIVATLAMAAGLVSMRPALRWGGFAFVLAAQITWLIGFYPSKPEISPFAAFSEPFATFDPAKDILVLGAQTREPALRWYYPHVFDGKAYAFNNGDSQQNVIDASFRSTFVMRADASKLALNGERLFLFSLTKVPDKVAINDRVTDALNTITQGRDSLQTIAEDKYQLDIYDLSAN